MSFDRTHSPVIAAAALLQMASPLVPVSPVGATAPAQEEAA